MPEPDPPQETPEPEEEEENQDDTDETIPYGSTDSDDTLDYNDLVLEDDDKTWCFLTQEQKICCNTASFSVPRLIDGSPIQVSSVESSSSIGMSYTVLSERQRSKSRKFRSDIIEEYHGITDEDKAFMTLYSVTDKFAHLVGKKRKEATQQEKRDLAKQFLDAKKAECQSWIDNEVFDLVDMRKMKVRNFVAGRWVLTVKKDKDGNFQKCKARWVQRVFKTNKRIHNKQTALQHPEQALDDADLTALYAYMLMTCSCKVFEDKVLTSLRKDFKVGSEDKNDVMFVGQRIKWKTHDKYGPYISVDQKLAVDAVEVKIDKTLKDHIQCNPQLHTAYRSVLGQPNWLQSRTQVHLCYKFSRCASAASSPTIGDVKEINKVVRTLKSQYVDGRFWPLKGQQRILGMPDASYRNNSDKSSQRAHVIFLAEDRKIPSKTTYRSSSYEKKPDASTRGSIIDYPVVPSSTK
eukprot:s26_g85.t1